MSQSQIPTPANSAYTGPMYIKQIEDIYLPPQSFTTNGFAGRGRELKQPNQWSTKGPSVQLPLHREFLPMKANYNFYLANMKTGYVDRKTTYPNYTSGFRYAF